MLLWQDGFSRQAVASSLKELLVRIAVTSHGPDPGCDVDESFGRAYWFVVYDDVEDVWESFDNGSIRNCSENVGVRATEFLVDQGVNVIITGEAGPRAFRALTSRGIKVFLQASGTVDDMIRAWTAGQITEAQIANGKCSPFCLETLANGSSPLPANPPLVIVPRA